MIKLQYLYNLTMDDEFGPSPDDMGVDAEGNLINTDGKNESEEPKTPEVDNDLEAKKANIDKVWSEWKEVKDNPELMSLFDRKMEYSSDKDPQTLLDEGGYPERSEISDLQFENWKVNLDPKFIKDGYMYLMRGDHPNLEGKGFYTRTYGYGKKNSEQLSAELEAHEVDYFLYHYLNNLKESKSYSSSTAEELAFAQSAVGGSSFVSTTINIESAIAGTGNQPDPDEASKYEVYILKIPVDYVINRHGHGDIGLLEKEYLIPDYVRPDEIVAKFPKDDKEGVYQFLNQELGVSKQDIFWGSHESGSSYE